MALSKGRQVLVSISFVLFTIFHTGCVASAPSPGLQDVAVLDEMITTDLPASSVESVELPEEKEGLVVKSNSTEESSRTLESMMNMIGSFNIFSNMANLFGTQGTRYEWVPLGSLIFTNRLGQGTNNKKAAS